MSDRRVADEIHQQQRMALVTPSIFLAVSVFVVFNIVLPRMVHHQQEQLATLRVFGYRRWKIGGNYVKFVLLLVAVGAITGCAMGAWLADWMTGLFAPFFRFPVVHNEFAVGPAASTVTIALVGALMGSGSALRQQNRSDRSRSA